MRGFAELPQEQQAVLLLITVEDFTYEEAAHILGVPIGTVMSRLSRARERLRLYERWSARAATAGVGGNEGAAAAARRTPPCRGARRRISLMRPSIARRSKRGGDDLPSGIQVECRAQAAVHVKRHRGVEMDDLPGAMRAPENDRVAQPEVDGTATRRLRFPRRPAAAHMSSTRVAA
jgi:hypothetical protein